MARSTFLKPSSLTRSRRLGRRPTVEGLEGRALLSRAGSLDPTFGGTVAKGVVYQSTTGSDAAFPQGSSIALQQDGKIIVAGMAQVSGATVESIGRRASNGSVDTTFGTNGSTVLTFPVGFTSGTPGTTYDVATSPQVLIQPDGRIMATGVIQKGSGLVETYAIRLNANGSPETTFGTNSLVLINRSGAALPYATLQADGKIVLAGAIPTSANPNNTQVAALRLNANGQVDSTFGTNGLVTLSINNSGGTSTFQEEAQAVGVAPASKIVLFGQTETSPSGGSSQFTTEVFRLNSNGSIDSSFHGNGMVTQPSASLDGGAVQPDGKVLLLSTESNFLGATLLVRLNTDGSKDTATTGVPQTDNLTLQPDGKIVLVQVLTGPTALKVTRLNANLQRDLTFGTAGISTDVLASAPQGTSPEVDDVAVGGDGRVVVSGSDLKPFNPADPGKYFVARLTATGSAVQGDYDGDGLADAAVYLPSLGAYAIRPSGGGPDQIIPFGSAGAGQTIPAPGDYDGLGKTDMGIYLPSLGAFAYRPIFGGNGIGQIVPFGMAGIGNSIPAQGDYFGTKRDNLAVYLPSLGAFAIRPGNGSPDQIIPFGIPGAGQSIPVPGDYDGSGRTELAVYLPSLGAFAYRPANGGPDVIIPFGQAGAGNSLPMPGDYDGSGRTELAVYLPSLGAFAFRPAGGGPDVIIPFGGPGAGQTIPAAGDYSGSGHLDLGVYLPTSGVLAYRSSTGGNDVLQLYGIAGPGQSIPATVVVQSALPGTVSALGQLSAASVEIPLTEGDMVSSTATKRPKAIGG
jgi:uncharacterized delta-60 repeat protein